MCSSFCSQFPVWVMFSVGHVFTLCSVGGLVFTIIFVMWVLFFTKCFVGLAFTVCYVNLVFTMCSVGLLFTRCSVGGFVFTVCCNVSRVFTRVFFCVCVCVCVCVCICVCFHNGFCRSC